MEISMWLSKITLIDYGNISKKYCLTEIIDI